MLIFILSAVCAGLIVVLSVFIKKSNALLKDLEFHKKELKGYQRVLDSLPYRVFWKDCNLNYLGCNELFRQDSGHESIMDMIGHDDFEMSWKKNAEFYRADDKNVLQSAKSKINYVEEQETTDSSEISYLTTSKIPLFDDAGQVCGVVGTYQDSTELNTAMVALQESEEKLRIIANQSFLGLAIIQDDHIAYANETVADLCGLPLGEVLNESIELFIGWVDPLELPRLVQLRKKLDESGKSFSGTFRFYGKNREIAWLNIHCARTNFQGRNATLLVIRDITAHKETEIELRSKNELFDKILSTIPVSIFWKDCDSIIRGCNDEFARKSGFAIAEDIIGRDDFELFGKHATSYRTADLHIISTGESMLDYQESFTAYHNGRNAIIQTSKVPLKDENGDITGVLGMFSDITEKKQMEQQLYHSQKMDSLGQLAGGVAHDFNNMLAGIMGAADLLALKLGEDSRFTALVSVIQESSERAADLTRQLLSFARKQDLGECVIDINSAITGATEMLKRSIDPRIKISNILTASNTAIVGDLSLLQSAVLNLGLNARDAMPEGGELTIEAVNVHLGFYDCQKFEQDLEPGNYIKVIVSDNGVGMEQEICDRIFEPFFTTKDVGKGTGLGLSSVYGTVQNHGGVIDVLSEVGKGTAFELFFPVVERSISSIDGGYEPGEIFRGEGGILVIDDEPVIRVTVCKMLEELGYSTIVAENGAHGLDVYRDNHKDIRAVIVDMVMPEMSGDQCFKEIMAFNPEAKIILSSGFTKNVKIDNLLDSGLKGFIKKPYKRDSLSKILADAIV